jgi:hypothetical protein
VEAVIKEAPALSMRINAWEWRWPLNYRNRDASKLSRTLLDRLAEAEAMSLDDYRRDIAQRDKNRALYAELAGECEACISLSAPSAAPVGLESTGARAARRTRPTSAFPRSRCRCSATKGFPWACRSRASSTATPMPSPAPPRSRGCSETQTPASSADAFGALASVDLVFAEAGLYGR